MILTTINKNKFKFMEIIGAFFTFIVMIILGMCYEITDGAIWSILFACANNSVWEIIKIIVIPYIFWIFIELCYVRISINNIIVSKTIGVYSILISIIVGNMFYNFSPLNNMVLIKIIQATCIAISFFISYKISQSNINFKILSTTMAFALIILCVMILIFTIKPPQIWIFCDPITQKYGIPSQSMDTGAYYLDKLII